MVVVSTTAPEIEQYVRGDSRDIQVQCTQPDGKTPFDLTGCEVFLTINESATPAVDSMDATAILKKSTDSFDDASTGVATISLTNDDTKNIPAGTYFYDIQLKDSSGNITSLQANTWEFVDDISTRIT